MRTLLVLRALGLGDLLTGLPAYRALARAFPDHRRVLAAPKTLAPLAELFGTFAVVAEAQPLEPLGMAARNADVAVNLHGRGPQSTRILFESGAGRVIGFACRGLLDGPSYPQWRNGEPEVQRWCRMLAAFDIAANPDELDLRVEPDLAQRGAVVLHPGASAPARCWPESRWIELARRLRGAGIDVCISGSAAEFRYARRIARAAALPIDSVIAGKRTLPALARTIAGARALVCGDTGVAHLATAVGTPSVVLFGPMSPDEWGPPPSRGARHRAIWHGRRGDPHGLSLDEGLASIGIDEVVCELRRFVDVA